MAESETELPTIETGTTYISVREDGVVFVKVKAGAELSLDAAEENHVATARLVGDRDFVIVVDTRLAQGISREAREYYANPEVRQHTIAQALIIESSVSRVLGNFFIGLNKPPFPTQLFTSEEEAIAWLQSMRKSPGPTASSP